jgi:hypothetical protein
MATLFKAAIKNKLFFNVIYWLTGWLGQNVYVIVVKPSEVNRVQEHFFFHKYILILALKWYSRQPILGERHPYSA